jgi:pimeloyl-ACP methyl ester carboxylesterase
MGRVATVMAAVSLTMLLAAAAAAPALPLPTSASAAAADDGDFAGLVDIGGGRRLDLECRGTGSPTVVFESGTGNGADIWTEDGAEAWRERNPGASGISVLPAGARLTRVCAYDRPATLLVSGEPSRSDPVPVPRSLDAMVADLHALLRAGDVPGPYVLVGHSFGGMVARLFASTYPDEVAGFVSVDAANETFYVEGYEVLLRPDQYEPPTDEYEVVAAAARLREARIDQPLHQMPMVVLEQRDRHRERALHPVSPAGARDQGR